jgi:hypothetical protein
VVVQEIVTVKAETVEAVLPEMAGRLAAEVVHREKAVKLRTVSMLHPIEKNLAWLVQIDQIEVVRMVLSLGSHLDCLDYLHYLIVDPYNYVIILSFVMGDFVPAADDYWQVANHCDYSYIFLNIQSYTS